MDSEGAAAARPQTDSQNAHCDTRNDGVPAQPPQGLSSIA